MKEAILSKREEVLNLLSEGMSNRDLAVPLKLSEHSQEPSFLYL